MEITDNGEIDNFDNGNCQQGLFVTVLAGTAYRHLFPRQEFF